MLLATGGDEFTWLLAGLAVVLGGGALAFFGARVLRRPSPDNATEDTASAGPEERATESDDDVTDEGETPGDE